VGNKISRWAKRQLPQLRSTGEKLVLMALAVDADGDGNCDPETSLNKIADDCGVSRTTAKAALGRLRDAKLLEVAQRVREDGSHDNSGYRLTIKGGAESGPPLGQNLPHPPVKNCPTPGAATGPGGAESGPPPTSGNAGGGSESGPPTSFLHPSDVAAPRPPATHAHTPARVHDAPAREQPPPEKTQRRRTLEHLDNTAHHPDTHRLITAWTAGHTTPQSRTLTEQMTRLVDGCVRGGYDTDCLAAALHTWNARPDLGSPKALQFLYDDAVSRKNGGADPDTPLIDHNGFPRIDPQGIPDDYLTRDVVNRVLGPDSQPPARYPGDAEDIDYTDPAAAQARRDFFAAHAETRLSERRAEVRRVLVRAWNRRGAA
jgi:hypothetical protein